ncbi:hypothetical protein J6590_103032, partial [Homalodisca vitripennis]
DLMIQNKGESRYSTRSMVLMKSGKVTDRIRTCAISNSDLKSNIWGGLWIDRSSLLQRITARVDGTALVLKAVTSLDMREYCPLLALTKRKWRWRSLRPD